MVILNSIQSILCIILIIIIGYILSKRGWFDENSSKLLSRLVCNISLPALMISNLLTTFSKKTLVSSFTGLIIPFASILICFLISIICSKLFTSKERQGIFQTMFVVSNTIFIGLPVNIALFGEKSLPFALLYYIANTSFFWTIGVYLISKDGKSKGNKIKILSLKSLKSILSPPLLGFIVGIILVLLNIKLPQFIMDTCKYLGNLTTPLSLLFIGITFKSINLKDVKFDTSMLVILVGRFILSPLAVFLLSFFIHIPSLMLKVFIIQASMPIMAQTSIISKEYNADYKYATVMVTISTVISLVVIPIYMVLLSKI